MPPKSQDLHHDRGDGVCNECFEEFPCSYVEAVQAGAGTWGLKSGLREYQDEIRAKAHETEEARERRAWETFCELFVRAGLPAPELDRYSGRKGFQAVEATYRLRTKDQIIPLLEKAIKWMEANPEENNQGEEAS